MENQKDAFGLLDLLTAPGFCVRDHRILKTNPAAAGLQLVPDMDITPLLSSSREAYEAFAGGCLCLTLTYLDTPWTATVTRYPDADVFVLEDNRQPELQALALAARELRGPLNNAMLMADKLLDTQDETTLDQVSRLNRGLYQLLRIVGNMSDAGYPGTFSEHMLHEMNTVMDEIIQKLRYLTEAAGLQLEYTGLSQSVWSLCNPPQLERALMNLLSNAIKFAPRGSVIRVHFSQTGNLLRLSMEDSGCGIGDGLLRSIFSRYLRQATIEDSRHGLGLGMVLIRNAALQHGGTVLIDRPETSGTRVTLTLAIRQDSDCLRQNVLRPLAGGYDPGLIELSDVLPAHMFDGTH